MKNEWLARELDVYSRMLSDGEITILQACIMLLALVSRYLQGITQA